MTGESGASATEGEGALTERAQRQGTRALTGGSGAQGARARSGVPRSGPCNQDRTEGIRPRRGGRLRAALLLSAAVRSPGLRQACARGFRGRRDWTERERTPRRTQWRGRGHESDGGDGRTAGRRSRVDRRNSGEGFRPRGGDLRRAKAWESFSRGRGDTGTYTGELDRAKLAGHRASTADRRGRAPEMPKLAEHRAELGKLSTGKGVSLRGGARGGLARSPVS
jgi:hypothetical protein